MPNIKYLNPVQNFMAITVRHDHGNRKTCFSKTAALFNEYTCVTARVS